jgi:hypothetical protein
MNNSTNASFDINGVQTGSFDYNYNLWQKILFSLFIAPIIILSILGNVLVIVSICKYSYLRITNNIFLCSLAFADCAVGNNFKTFCSTYIWLTNDIPSDIIRLCSHVSFTVLNLKIMLQFHICFTM